MQFFEHDSYDVPTQLNSVEETFKSLYLRHPQRHLDLPHELSECKDILLLAGQKSQSIIPAVLAETLEEDLFFHKGLDCEIYRHLRYLPCNWHSHSFFELVCVLEGRCDNYIVNQKLSMDSGDFCIISPGTRHAISVFSEDCVIFNVILRTSTFETAFFGTLAENDILSDFFMRTLYHSSNHPYLLFHTGEDRELRNFIGYAWREFSGNRQYKSRMLNTVISAFFITLLRNHGADVSFPDSATDDNDRNLIYILKYMQEHYTTITLKELSAFFNYSERQLQRIIKASTGMSFSENIQKMKMRQAVRLLEHPDLSVASIAEELGYADTGNFRYVFKKYYGMTPVEFRGRQG